MNKKNVLSCLSVAFLLLCGVCACATILPSCAALGSSPSYVPAQPVPLAQPTKTDYEIKYEQTTDMMIAIIVMDDKFEATLSENTTVLDIAKSNRFEDMELLLYEYPKADSKFRANVLNTLNWWKDLQEFAEDVSDSRERNLEVAFGDAILTMLTKDPSYSIDSIKGTYLLHREFSQRAERLANEREQIFFVETKEVVEYLKIYYLNDQNKVWVDFTNSYSPP